MAYRGTKYDRDPVATQRRQTTIQLVVLAVVALVTLVLVWQAMLGG